VELKWKIGKMGGGEMENRQNGKLLSAKWGTPLGALTFLLEKDLAQLIKDDV
jgi:hypothetical protein